MRLDAAGRDAGSDAQPGSQPMDPRTNAMFLQVHHLAAGAAAIEFQSPIFAIAQRAQQSARPRGHHRCKARQPGALELRQEFLVRPHSPCIQRQHDRRRRAMRAIDALVGGVVHGLQFWIFNFAFSILHFAFFARH
jgi:hypothetical protein